MNFRAEQFKHIFENPFKTIQTLKIWRIMLGPILVTGVPKKGWLRKSGALEPTKAYGMEKRAEGSLWVHSDHWFHSASLCRSSASVGIAKDVPSPVTQTKQIIVHVPCYNCNRCLFPSSLLFSCSPPVHVSLWRRELHFDGLEGRLQRSVHGRRQQRPRRGGWAGVPGELPGGKDTSLECAQPTW